MPAIVATPYPSRGQVLIQASFGDVPTATNICVEAVTAAGSRPLHPYVLYNSDGCEALSCGEAVFWDTEIGCGVPTSYCATAVTAAGGVVTEPADPLVSDTFNRVVANGWGTADTGELWTVTGGIAADYSVTGTRAQQSLTSTGVTRIGFLTVGTPNYSAMVTVIPTVVALTQPIEAGMEIRRDDAANNGYRITLLFSPAGVVAVSIQRNLGGVVTTLASATLGFVYNAATQIHLLAQCWGSQLQVTAWESTTPQPPPTLTFTDTAIADGSLLRLRSQRQAGNTNGTVNLQFDNLSVLDVCAMTQPVTVCTEQFTFECDGCFRLGDPVRPCNDVRICLCADGVSCGGTGGLFFVSMPPDTLASNSGQLVPVNSAYPIPVSRTRRKPTSELQVVATSFVARDALTALLEPGSPLLLRSPAGFGIGDRYIQIGDVPISQGQQDLTSQPRLIQMPNAQVLAPVGPTQGVCGARVEDLCDVYPTWDALIAAGLTYLDLLLGNASTTPAALATWASTNAAFGSWNALQAGETDWTDVLDGD